MAGEKLAFCPILWQANGGQVDRRGVPLPLLHDEEYVGGYCKRDHDCGKCPELKYYFTSVHPQEQAWVCPGCLPKLDELLKQAGKSHYLPGYFSEGICEYAYCQRQEASPFLQIVIGPVPKRM